MAERGKESDQQKNSYESDEVETSTNKHLKFEEQIRYKLGDQIKDSTSRMLKGLRS